MKKTGKRYLWVDRYCIPQSDIQQRREAILNMNQIYDDAEVTIVALCGNNIRAGHPGVSSVFRSGLQPVSTQGGQLVSTLPHLDTVICQSTWSTRGWTYQEARLSRRCLFFFYRVSGLFLLSGDDLERGALRWTIDFLGYKTPQLERS